MTTQLPLATQRSTPVDRSSVLHQLPLYLALIPLLLLLYQNLWVARLPSPASPSTQSGS